MDKREVKFWQWLDGQIGGRWHAQRHEDRYATGIPDVSWGCAGTGGWIELKSLERVPSTMALCYSSEQANWAFLRGRVSHNVWIFAELGDQLVLWLWDRSHQIRETDNAEELLKLADKIWKKQHFNPIHFLRVITDGKNTGR